MAAALAVEVAAVVSARAPGLVDSAVVASGAAAPHEDSDKEREVWLNEKV